MSNHEEVIDVEEYHHKLRNKSNNLKRSHQKLKQENAALETKLNKISHVNDALHRQVYEQNQQQRRVAQLLGFDDFSSVQVNITASDPWIPGGQSRILFLQDEIAKHLIECGKDAEAMRADMTESLTDAQDEAKRMREGRDAARREAERQAAAALLCHEELRKCQDEVQFWRNEVTTKLPEMQALIKEQQLKSAIQNTLSTDAVKIASLQGESGPLPLREIANTLPSPNNGRSSSLLYTESDLQYYKTQNEQLEAKYTELLASKRKVSQRYFEDLKRWKEFKEWIVKDEVLDGHVRRRTLKRRKAMEFRLQQHRGATSLEDISPLVASRENQVRKDKDVNTLHPTNELRNVEHSDDKHTDISTQRNNFHCRVALTPGVSPPRPGPLEKGQPFNLTLSDDRPASPVTITSLNCDRSEQVPFSQESMTQPSSAPLSPACDPSIHVCAIIPGASACSPLQVNPSLKRVHMLKKEPEEQRLSCDVHDGPSTKPVIAFHPTSLDSRDNMGIEAGKVAQDPLLDCKCVHTDGSTPGFTTRQSSKVKVTNMHITGPGLERTRPVLAADTPPRANTLVRRHSLPLYSSHAPSVTAPCAIRKVKRKVSDMEDANVNAHQGRNSDPFVVESSKLLAKPLVSQKQEQRASHLKTSREQFRMAEYMAYKGRGRYSNAKAASSNSVNAEFEIDPTRNGGVKYQFDAVVRDKSGRKNLEASDCECCRDYYEVVGPLPPRLEAPKWRSPQKQKHWERKHRNNGNFSESPASAQSKAIQSRKSAISRHRHNWAPPTTPPSYWNIGFPDTQEVEDINRQANDIHARKFQRIEVEANSKNGRYRRRE